ncbi:unnamed protein product [Caenorhabditis auriculariae]|uniref:Uncharacterized protein n=1 Tax=Caenorhabditis auriculariae TaxID=2777116 RepID=A0A8S1HMG2_9PELO|nr:unnamed protein product [Caenorhabditis auriculariae]
MFSEHSPPTDPARSGAAQMEAVSATSSEASSEKNSRDWTEDWLLPTPDVVPPDIHVIHSCSPSPSGFFRSLSI